MKFGAAALLKASSARGSHLGGGQIEIDHQILARCFWTFNGSLSCCDPERQPGLSMCVAGSNAMETSIPNYSSGDVATRASTAAAARAVFPISLNVLAGFSREGAAAAVPPPPRHSRPPLPLQIGRAHV